MLMVNTVFLTLEHTIRSLLSLLQLEFQLELLVFLGELIPIQPRDLTNAGLNPRLLSTFTTDQAEWMRVCHAPDVHQGGGQRALQLYACILAVSALLPHPASLSSRP